MYQLKAIIWKSYKVRVRSPLSTVVDLIGPLAIVMLYIVAKFIINQSGAPPLEEETKGIRYFRNLKEGPLDVRRELRSFTCSKVLYFSTGGGRGSMVESALQNDCGLELIRTSDRSSLIARLRESLDRRMSYKKAGVDLNRSNSSSSGGSCLRLPEAGGGDLYELGLVHRDGDSIEIHSTEFGSNPVINMPYSQGSPYNEYKLPQSALNLGTHMIEICIGKAFRRLANRDSEVATRQSPGGDIKWRFKPYPVVTGIYVLPMSTAFAVMIGSFCTNIATVLRIAEANESGLHRYMRIAGLPACYYWIGLQTIVLVQTLVQSLLTSIILAIPTGEFISDALSEASMTLRWVLIFTYSLASNSYATLIASLFDRAALALLVLVLFSSVNATYPLLLLLQWTPFGFTSFTPINFIALCSPVACFEALVQVMVGVSLQTNQAFDWHHLGERIINGGMTYLSTGELLIFLLAQCFIWTLLTILIDQYRFSTASDILGFLCGFCNEMCFSNCCCAATDNLLTEDLKTKTITSIKTTASRLDPNRICCSLRHITVRGATTLVPYTRGNPLRFTPEQLRAFRRQAEDRPVSKTTEYLINRKQQSYSYAKAREEPIMIDEAIRQNIVWYSTDFKLENLELDFRFNEISFVLGQVHQKELLFHSILGVRSLDSGHIIIDGVKYTATSLGLARRQIGYLSDRDTFYNELTVFENLQLFGSLREPMYKNYESESLFILNLLHMYSRRTKKPAYLTQRSARKLALGVASVGHTKLLLLTEPTANLSWRPRCQVYNLLKKYKSIRSIVIDSSDVDEAVAFGDRILLLKNGKANLNESPARLEKRLGCGYWLVFAPTTGDGRSVGLGAIKALEKLTSDLFQRDKIDLDPTRRSIYHKLNPDRNSEGPKPAERPASAVGESGSRLGELANEVHKTIIIVKVRHSAQSTKALCNLLKLFASQSSVHGFQLAHLSYESLEDILVLRMSRAIYPDLPPDLLLSLQHRTRINYKMQEQSAVSVRRLTSRATSDSPNPQTGAIFSANLASLVRDRFSERFEIVATAIAYACSLMIVFVTLIALKNSLGSEELRLATNATTGNSTQLQQVSPYRLDGGPDRQSSVDPTLMSELGSKELPVDSRSLQLDLIEQLYKYRVGLYILEKSSNNSLETDVVRWDGNRNIVGTIDLGQRANQTDAEIVADLIHVSKDLASSFVAFNPQNNEATVIFEPYLPHVMMATVKKFINFNLAPRYAAANRARDAVMSQSSCEPNKLSLSSPTITKSRDGRSPVYTTSIHYFHHPWHEMINGYTNRRMIYGVGFATAESIAIGVLVLAPMRHRAQWRLARVQTGYWFNMAIIDMTSSLVQIIGYIFLFIIIEGLGSISLILAMFIALLLYKLASLPVPYTISIASERALNGFLFIVMLYIFIVWNFAIILRTFVEWTLITNNYLYTIATWLLFGLPITALIDSLTVIGTINNIDARCREVPAYTRTSHRVDIDGVRRVSIIDDLYEKVRQCLASGKSAIETNVLHQENLGILWFIYLIVLFGFIGWIFLLTSERFFGTVARRLDSTRTSADPMKTVMRVSDTVGSLFKWDKERDRLISEYIKCLNEINYVKSMANNCLILRIWLKPMSDQASIDRKLSKIIEPLFVLGHTKNEIQVELRTTLQIFIRIGDESRRCRVNKVQLIETYTKYAEQHTDTVAKIAVVDWTRENLYKIVLHGHYNTKINTTV